VFGVGDNQVDLLQLATQGLSVELVCRVMAAMAIQFSRPTAASKRSACEAPGRTVAQYVGTGLAHTG